MIDWLEGFDVSRAAAVLSRPPKILRYRHRCARRPIISRLNKILQAIIVLETDSYWTRLWFVQEIVLARRIWMLCQDVFLSWNDYYSLSEYTKDLGAELPETDGTPWYSKTLLREE